MSGGVPEVNPGNNPHTSSPMKIRQENGWCCWPSIGHLCPLWMVALSIHFTGLRHSFSKLDAGIEWVVTIYLLVMSGLLFELRSLEIFMA